MRHAQGKQLHPVQLNGQDHVVADIERGVLPAAGQMVAAAAVEDVFSVYQLHFDGRGGGQHHDAALRARSHFHQPLAQPAERHHVARLVDADMAAARYGAFGRPFTVLVHMVALALIPDGSGAD